MFSDYQDVLCLMHFKVNQADCSNEEDKYKTEKSEKNYSRFQFFRLWADFRPSRGSSMWSLRSVKIQWEIQLVRGEWVEVSLELLALYIMVHLSKFAGFHQEMNGNLLNIVSLLQITTNFRIIMYKCPPNKGYFT